MGSANDDPLLKSGIDGMGSMGIVPLISPMASWMSASNLAFKTIQRKNDVCTKEMCLMAFMSVTCPPLET